jgi:DNA-binding protein YbaB
MNNQLNTDELTKQAESLKEKLQQAYAAIEKSTFVGKSGDDEASIEVSMTGRHEVTQVEIKRGLMNALLEGTAIEEAQMEQMCSVLGQVVMFAVNDAVKKVGDMSRQKFSELAADMQLDHMDS